uniref:NADH-ubiquinone oxidoreductase chain 4 n=1 Tax=Cotylurus marcogliesei TaxID=2282156 RepID=A0A7D5BQI9_9TREM|nr:NADH dehydrogenase subunit 4 [Cotylurus marcogliesei]
MKIKFIDWYSSFVVFVGGCSLLLLWSFCSVGLGVTLDFGYCSMLFNSYFIFDLISFYLSLLSVLLLFLLNFFYNVINLRSRVYVIVSIFSSILCYCSNHVFFFWWFYEVSILVLLFLLVVDSPYSERYLAGWYLAGYVVLTSLPMLLCLIYFSCVSGSLFMSDWLFLDLWNNGVSLILFVVLGVLFVTKIPVPPFHVWLPLVHAEATSIVSVCLSGYIMKLGLLGVCRFCWWVLPDYLFGNFYSAVSFFLAIIFFLMATWELDGKRWLAFLSLSHIIICVVCLNCSFYEGSGLLYLYSLGHGLSAALVFVFLWWGYNISGSRNWIILKSVLGGSLFFRILLCFSLCITASLPPVIQFFVEVYMLFNVGSSSWILFFIFCFYLFFSSLVPLFFLGTLLSRHFCISYFSFSGISAFSSCIVYLSMWSFIVFLFI